MNKLTDFFLKSWRGAVVALCLAAVAFVLYFHRLGNLLPGYAPLEFNTLHAADNWHKITNNPLNAPFTLCVWLLTAVHHNSILATRIVAAAFASLAGVIFFTVLRIRMHFYLALLGTMLFVTSAGLMHYGRLGSPQIMQTGILALMAAVLYYQRLERHRVLAAYGLVLLLSVLIYTPGIIWFELFGGVLLTPSIRRQLNAVGFKHQVGLAVLGLAVVAPLVVAIVKHPMLLQTLIGLPSNLHTLIHVAKNLLNTVLAVGIRGTGDPLYGVGHVPLLNIIELALMAFGLYAHIRIERSNRSVFLLGSIILSLVLISLGGAVGFASLVPLLYLLIGRGVSKLLSLWFTVFPRNPIAKGTSLLLICIMLFFSVLYQVRIYFVAWPHYLPTERIFSHDDTAKL